MRMFGVPRWAGRFGLRCGSRCRQPFGEGWDVRYNGITAPRPARTAFVGHTLLESKFPGPEDLTEHEEAGHGFVLASRPQYRVSTFCFACYRQRRRTVSPCGVGTLELRRQRSKVCGHLGASPWRLRPGSGHWQRDAGRSVGLCLQSWLVWSSALAGSRSTTPRGSRT